MHSAGYSFVVLVSIDPFGALEVMSGLGNKQELRQKRSPVTHLGIFLMRVGEKIFAFFS
jgi:hypothetical protein